MTVAIQSAQPQPLNSENVFYNLTAALAKMVREHGLKEYWVSALKDWSQRGILLGQNSYRAAEFYAQLGDVTRALDMLDEAYNFHDHQMAQIRVNPAFDNLRSHPRFLQLLKRMNFAP